MCHHLRIHWHPVLVSLTQTFDKLTLTKMSVVLTNYSYYSDNGSSVSNLLFQNVSNINIELSDLKHIFLIFFREW